MLGNAVGRITIDTSQLRRAQTVVQQASRQMANNLESFSTKSAKGLKGFKASLNESAQAVNNLRGELLGLGAAFTAASVGAAGFGLKAADNLQLLQVRFEEITGSQQEAVELMNRIGNQAKAAGLPVRETQRAFAGLVPAVEESGESIDDYINLVSRLSGLNPTEGIEGAVFALREAIVSGGTDLVSLSERFNIPRKQLRELIAETGSFSEALDIILTKQGATNRLAEAQAKSLSGSITQLRDSVTQLFEKAFLPYLDNAINIVQKLTSIIGSVEPALLANTVAAGGFVGVLATSLPVISTISSSLAKLGPLLKPLAAVGGGVALGIGAARKIGAATGNEALAQANLGTLIRNIADVFVFLAVVINKAAGELRIVFTQLLNLQMDINNRIKIAGLQLAVVFDDISILLSAVLATIAELLPGDNSGFVGRAIEAGQGAASRRQSRLDEIERARSYEVEPVDIEAIRQRTQETENQIVSSYMEFLDSFSREAEAETDVTGENVTNSFITMLRGFANKIKSNTEGALSELGDNVASNFDRNIQEQIELADMMENATAESLSERRAALEQEKRIIEESLGQLRSLAPFSESAAQKLSEYEDRLGSIDREFDRISQAMPAAIARATADINKEFAETEQNIKSNLASQLRSLNERLQQDIAKLNRDYQQQQADFRKKESDALQDFQRDDENKRQEHRERLAEIERTADEEVQNAAADLNATAVFNARNKEAEARQAETDRREKERQEQQQKLNDLQASLNAERQRIISNYNERLSDLNTSHKLEVQAAQQAAQQELQLAQQKRQQELQLLAQTEQNKALITKQGAEATSQITNNMWRSIVNNAKQAFNALNSMRPTTGNNLADRIRNTFNDLKRFDNGGVMPNDGLAFLHAGEHVRTPAAARHEEQLLQRLATQPTSINANVNISGTRLSAGELENAVTKALMRVVREM